MVVDQLQLKKKHTHTHKEEIKTNLNLINVMQCFKRESLDKLCFGNKDR